MVSFECGNITVTEKKIHVHIITRIVINNYFLGFFFFYLHHYTTKYFHNLLTRKELIIYHVTLFNKMTS